MRQSKKTKGAPAMNAPIRADRTPAAMTKSLKTLLRVAVLAALPMMADAQSPFSAVARVDDAIVSAYELDQRALFMEVIRTPGDVRAKALEALVNERLQVAEARRMGVVATPADIEAGIVEFSSRAELSPEQFLQAIGDEGVAPETFRDFVANGISWRNVVQTRFAARARAAISDAHVERALAFGPRLESAEILLAEIIVPITPENQDILRDELERLMGDLNFEVDRFSQAARRFSAADTRDQGGLTGWRALNTIPPQLREDMVLLAVGETYGPVNLGPALAIFQMRGLSEQGPVAPAVASVDYVTIALAPVATEAGAAAAAALRAEVDVCDDLYGLRPGGFERHDQPLGAIPTDIALALSGLDAGEMSFAVTRDGGATTLAVMLCARRITEPEGGVEAVRQQLFAESLAGYADALLEELRADAIIALD